MATKKTISAVGGLMVIGIGIGSAFGAAIDNIPVGMSIGLALGLIFGLGIDMNRRRKRDDTMDSSGPTAKPFTISQQTEQTDEREPE